MAENRLQFAHNFGACVMLHSNTFSLCAADRFSYDTTESVLSYAGLREESECECKDCSTGANCGPLHVTSQKAEKAEENKKTAEKQLQLQPPVHRTPVLTPQRQKQNAFASIRIVAEDATMLLRVYAQTYDEDPSQGRSQSRAQA